MRRAAFICFAILASVYPALLKAKTVELEPETQWHVVYEEDNCLLARIFGTAPNDVALTFRQASPRSPMMPTIFGSPVRPLTGPRTGLAVAFSKDATPVRVSSALTSTIGKDNKPLLILSPLDLLGRPTDEINDKAAGPEPTAEQLAAIEHMKILRGGNILVLHIGRLDKAIGELSKCTRDLVKAWGLDPAQQAALASPPQPLGSPGLWLRSGDYPASALGGGRSASIQFRLMVDKTGRPTACKIQQATNSPEFIDVTCELLMRRARFSPALTTDGSPVASYYTNSVNWLMPGL